MNNKFWKGFFAPLIAIVVLSLGVSLLVLPMIIMLFLGHSHWGYGVVNILWLMIICGLIEVSI